MKSPKVSVIMNCLNGEAYLRQAIESVFNQTYQDWEIVFWDNGSTDNSAEIAKSYGKRIRYFRSEQTFPLGKARNLCMAQANGDYIAFLDCDDFWLPQKLEKQVPLFDKDLEVALVFTDAIYFNDKKDICQIYKKFTPPNGRIFRQLFRKYFLCVTSVVIRRSSIRNMDWFDKRIKLFEDACFFLRLAYKYKLDYCNEILVRYRVRPDSGTIRDFGSLAFERDLTLKTLSKEFPGFEKKFCEDIKKFQAKTNAQKAIYEWANRNPEKARKILKETNPKNPLIYTLFFITFLPNSVFKYLFILNYQLKNWFNWYKFE